MTAIDRSACALVPCALQSFLVVLAQFEQQGLDVLAGSQRVDSEIRAGTGILKQTQAADGQLVAFAALWLDGVIPIGIGRWAFQNLECSCRCSLLTFRDPLRDEHGRFSLSGE